MGGESSKAQQQPKNLQIPSPRNSPQTQQALMNFSLPPKEKTNEKIELKNKITTLASVEHRKRTDEFVSKEDPISDKALAMKGDVDTQTTQQQSEQKALCAKELEECLEFNLISETNQVWTKESRNIICSINLKVNPLKGQRERIPMDLVCVIDDSGSMSGKKAQLVRKSLKYLLKIMNEDDRISLVSFDSYAKILTPFLRNNLNNKPQFKTAIKYIQGRGSTNIETGVEAGLWMIKNRQQKNPVTCLFLLSDGQDDSNNVNLRVQKLISEYDIKDNFIVNTYGYGADHDAAQMRHIAETHKGGYYYIEDVKKVSEWFVLSISGLLSAVGEELRVKIKSKNTALTSMVIKQLYGGEQLWVKSNSQKGEGELYLPHLIVGDDKFFCFDIDFDHTKFVLNDSTRNLIAFEADLEVKAVKQESIVRVSKTLEFEFKDVSTKEEIKENNEASYYEELVVTRQRAVGGLKIKQANALINEQKDYEQAKNVLKGYRDEMEKLGGGINKNVGMKHLDEDINEAIGKCSPRLFRKASFEKMEVVHGQRRNSISHCEDWNHEQADIMNKFKNKEMQLSDDSCSDSDDDDSNKNKQQNQLNLQKKVQAKKPSSKVPKRRGSFSDDEDSD